jgi:hypothetical protein
LCKKLGLPGPIFALGFKGLKKKVDTLFIRKGLLLTALAAYKYRDKIYIKKVFIPKQPYFENSH